MKKFYPFLLIFLISCTASKTQESLTNLNLNISEIQQKTVEAKDNLKVIKNILNQKPCEMKKIQVKIKTLDNQLNDIDKNLTKIKSNIENIKDNAETEIKEYKTKYYYTKIICILLAIFIINIIL